MASSGRARLINPSPSPLRQASRKLELPGDLGLVYRSLSGDPVDRSRYDSYREFLARVAALLLPGETLFAIYVNQHGAQLVGLGPDEFPLLMDVEASVRGYEGQRYGKDFASFRLEAFYALSPEGRDNLEKTGSTRIRDFLARCPRAQGFDPNKVYRLLIVKPKAPRIRNRRRKETVQNSPLNWWEDKPSQNL